MEEWKPAQVGFSVYRCAKHAGIFQVLSKSVTFILFTPRSLCKGQSSKKLKPVSMCHARRSCNPSQSIDPNKTLKKKGYFPYFSMQTYVVGTED